MTANNIVFTSDGTINWNRVSEISYGFLESKLILESEEIDLISDLANDST